MPGRARCRRDRVTRWRTTRWVAAGIVTAFGVTAATGIGSSGAAPRTPTAPAAEDFNLGVGQAVAQGIKIDPVAGGLSLGITLGESLAGHQNTVATGESRPSTSASSARPWPRESCDGGEPTMPEEEQPQALRRRLDRRRRRRRRPEQDDGSARAADREVRHGHTSAARPSDHDRDAARGPRRPHHLGVQTQASSAVIDDATREAGPSPTSPTSTSAVAPSTSRGCTGRRSTAPAPSRSRSARSRSAR